LDPLNGLATLADNSVDVTLTDPPYSDNLYSRTRTNKWDPRHPDKDVQKAQKSAHVLASRRIGAIEAILEEVCEHLLRLTRRWILIFCDDELAHKWREALGSAYVRTGLWVKTDPMPQLTGDRPAQGHEAFVLGHRPGQKRWNGGGRPGTYLVGTCKGKARPNHPCPKPLALMRQLVADFSEPGELVLDPFTGSGTTGVACRELGRNFVGWEKDPEYHALAERRIQGAALVPDPLQPELF
jgi:site-specific DNA-methyltransferase (adenine-specific)